MRRILFLLLAVLVACTPEAREVPATELIVRVTANADVQDLLARVQMRTARSNAQNWNLSTHKTYEVDVLTWPIDFVVVPSRDWIPGSNVEIVVDALDASDRPLVQARVLTSFVTQQTRIVTVSLARCGTMALGELCESNPDCYGPTCRTCVSGACAVTPLTATEDLPTLIPDDSESPSDSGQPMDASPEAGSPDAATTPDASPFEAGAMSNLPDAGSNATEAGSVAIDAGDPGDSGSCPSGFMRTGSDCADIDECATQNGGCPANSKCENTAGGHECSCNVGYVKENDRCRDLCAGACDPMASCTAASGAPQCSCPASYITSNGGKTCTFDASCSLLQCDANATCTVSGTTRTCTCRTGYSGNGMTCANTNECSVTPPVCGDNSTCADTPGSYTCGCQTNYRRVGNTCVKNPCAPNPCQNGGICSETSSGGAACACATGFDGPLCAHNIDDCALRPCQNGGTCTDGANTRSCSCPPGFSGPDCEARICTGTVSIRLVADLEIYRDCAEITGNLEIPSTGLSAITSSDFPYLKVVRGDLRMTAFAGSATTPQLVSVTLSKLTTVEGQLLLGASNQGTLQDVSLPALTTIGKPGDTALRLYVVMAYTRSLRMPALTTIYGNAQIGVLPSLCTVDFQRVSTLTGKLDLINIWNIPVTSFGAMIQAAQRGGGVTQTNIGCCIALPSSQSNCNGTGGTPICGC